MVGPGSHKSKEATVLFIFSDDASPETVLCYEALGLVDKILTETRCILLLDMAVMIFFFFLF